MHARYAGRHRRTCPATADTSCSELTLVSLGPRVTNDKLATAAVHEPLLHDFSTYHMQPTHTTRSIMPCWLVPSGVILPRRPLFVQLLQLSVLPKWIQRLPLRRRNDHDTAIQHSALRP